MSATANWTYTNVAKVRPFESIDMRDGKTTYGPEFEIACTWTAGGEMERELGGQGGAQGAEFVSRHVIFTEDRRPKYLDQIQFDGSNGWEKIRSVTSWDMSFFNEEPDVKLVT